MALRDQSPGSRTFWNDLQQIRQDDTVAGGLDDERI